MIQKKKRSVTSLKEIEIGEEDSRRDKRLLEEK